MEAYYFIVKGLLGNLQTQAIANSPQLMDLLLKTTSTKRWKENHWSWRNLLFTQNLHLN